MSSIGYPLEKGVVKAFRRFLGQVGDPWRLAGFGRPPKRRPSEYAFALFVKVARDLSYRTAECLLGIPRSSLHWAFKRLPLAWLRQLLVCSAALLRKLVKPKCGILDSTGVSLTGFGCTRRSEWKDFWKLHVLAEYAPQASAVWVACAKPTSKHAADVVVGRKLLAESPPPTTLFGDKAYDDRKLFALAYRQGWRVCMQQRKTSLSLVGLRGRVWRDYDNDLRKRYRGMVETIFAAFSKRHSSRINERLSTTRAKTLLFWCINHNTRTTNKIKTTTLLIYWTLSLERKVFIASFLASIRRIKMARLTGLQRLLLNFVAIMSGYAFLTHAPCGLAKKGA